MITVRLEKARDGGMMVRLPNGKIAFPERKTKIPENAKIGDCWMIEIVRETQKVGFFKMIRSEKNQLEIDRLDYKKKIQAENVIALDKAIEEFPEDKTFREWKEYNLRGGWLGTPIEIRFRCERLRKDAALKNVADKILSEIKSWNEPDPGLPAWPRPEDVNICGVVTSHISWKSAWEGDGMRPGNNTRHATEHGYEVTVDVESVKAHFSEWETTIPVKIKSIIRIGGFGHNPSDFPQVGEIVFVSISKCAPAAYYNARDTWREQARSTKKWEWKKKFQSLAKMVDGVVSVPIEVSSGNLKCYRVNPEKPFTLMYGDVLSTWEDLESFSQSGY